MPRGGRGGLGRRIRYTQRCATNSGRVNLDDLPPHQPAIAALTHQEKTKARRDAGVKGMRIVVGIPIGGQDSVEAGTGIEPVFTDLQSAA
mgnify:FL=1